MILLQTGLRYNSCVAVLSYCTLFAEELLKRGNRPRVIQARDERALLLLQDLCGKTGIPLERENSLPALEEAMVEIQDNMDALEDDGIDPEELEQLCEGLMTLRDSELKRMSPFMVGMILEMADMGILPEKLEKRIKKIFRL